jgi:ribosomal protein L34E
MSFVEETVPGSINQVRPLVVNSTNRKTLRKLYKATSAEALVGKKIQLFLQPGVRDPSTGDKVDGIRIRDKVPTGAKYVAPKCEGCGKEIKGMANFTPEQIASGSKQKYGKCLCVECGQKAKAELEAANTVKAEEVTAAVNAEPESDLAAQLMAAAEE